MLRTVRAGWPQTTAMPRPPCHEPAMPHRPRLTGARVGCAWESAGGIQRIQRIQHNAANGIGGMPPAAANDRPGPAMPYPVSCAAGTALSLGIGSRWRQNGIRSSQFAGWKGKKKKNGRRMRLGPGQRRCNAVLGKSWLFLGSTRAGSSGKGWQGTSIRRNLGLWAMQETLAGAHWSQQAAVGISSEPQLRIS